MAKKENINVMPAGGGLFRPNDEDSSAIRLKPEYVVAATVVIILFEIFLHLYGRAWF